MFDRAAARTLPACSFSYPYLIQANIVEYTIGRGKRAADAQAVGGGFTATAIVPPNDRTNRIDSCNVYVAIVTISGGRGRHYAEPSSSALRGSGKDTYYSDTKI